MVRNLAGKSFGDKGTTMRAMLGEAGEVIFIGSGKLLKDGKIIKNVVVIGRDGKVTRMTLDGQESLGRLPNRVRQNNAPRL